MKLVEEQRM